jgi:hypothetical protein
VLFSQGGLQQIMIFHEEGDTYANEISDRVLSSVELIQVSNIMGKILSFSGLFLFFDSYCHSLAGLKRKQQAVTLKISSIKGLNLQNPY